MPQLRLAVRALARAPGFAATAIATLALGIGLSTAVFTIADALLRRGLPVGGEDRLIVLWGETRDGGFSNYPLDIEDVRAFTARARALDDGRHGEVVELRRDGSRRSFFGRIDGPGRAIVATPESEDDRS